MTLPPENPPAGRCGWLAVLGRLFVAGGVGCGTLSTAGAEPPAATAAADGPLTLRVRKAMWDHPAFKKINVGVRVRDGVATLHGPIPHAALADQAVACARGVPGVRDVVNELYVVADDDPLAKATKPPITARRADEKDAPPKSPQPEASANHVPTVAPIAPPQAAPATLIERVAQLRDRDSRFGSIRIEVRGGHVYLRGTVGRSQDAWDFARSVRALPGVIGVTQGVTTAP